MSIILGKDPNNDRREVLVNASGQLDVIATGQASENHLGEVGGSSAVVDVTLTLDTNVYASGDVLAEVQEAANVLRVSGGSAVLHSLQVIDKDYQGQALDVVLFDNISASLGTENAAVSITDTDAAGILGVVEVASADYVDLTNSQIASKADIGLVLEVSSGTSIGVGAISRGTGTYTANGIVLRLGVLQD